MDAVLLLAHGSREGDTQKTMARICGYVREMMDKTLIEEAYLQFCDTTLEAGLESLISKGATDIKIIPYFLFEGVHIKEDIPAEIKEFEQRHPGVSIRFGKTLGSDPRLAQIVVDRIKEM